MRGLCRILWRGGRGTGGVPIVAPEGGRWELLRAGDVGSDPGGLRGQRKWLSESSAFQGMKNRRRKTPPPCEKTGF